MAAAFRMLVRDENGKSQTALLNENRLIEYYEEEKTGESLVGAVFLGKVERVLPDVKAAFVRIGLKQNGFLPIREAESFHRTMGAAPLITGQDVLVQVKKDPKGDKGAFLTRDIAFAGQYGLLMPRNRFIGLSKRIEDAADRSRAKALGESVADGRFGLIVRHAALLANRQAVCEEVREMWARWQALEQSAAYVKAPQLIYREPTMAGVLLRDYAARHTIAVQANKSVCLDVQSPCSLETLTAIEMEAAWRAARVDQQLKEALSRRVQLPGGGFLVIDEREALQTIDVNSGSAVKAQEGQSLALSENLAAVPEIARQIRLRGLSGIVLIDFIDMDSESEREQVLAAMEEAVRDDRVKTVIHGFTRLGLLEMTRKRTRDSLLTALTDPCGACRETGRILRG